MVTLSEWGRYTPTSQASPRCATAFASSARAEAKSPALPAAEMIPEYAKTSALTPRASYNAKTRAAPAKSPARAHVVSAAAYRPAYTEEHVEELLIAGDAYRQDRGFDVLLTSEWGEGFDNLMNVDDQFTLSAKEPSKQLRRPPSPAVGRLGRELSPRYHFGEFQLKTPRQKGWLAHFW